MTTRVFTTTSELAALQVAWRDLHASARGTIFQTLEWNATWWQVFGEASEMRVWTAWEGNEIIGLAPFFLQQLRWGPVQLRRMSLLGEAVIPGVYVHLTAPGRDQEVAGALARYWQEMLLEEAAEIIDLHLLPAHHSGIDTLRSILAHSMVRMRYNPVSLPRMVISLPGSWEEYLSRLSKKNRANLRRTERKLHSSGAVFSILANPEEMERGFSEFVHLHNRVWASRGREGYFASRPGFQAFFSTLLPQLTARNQARILTLLTDGNPLASLLVFSVHGHTCAYLSGRDPRIRTGAGVWLLARAVREAIGEGCQEMDLLEGLASYKARLGGEHTSFARLSVWPSGMGAWRGQAFVAGLLGRSFLDSGRLPAFLSRFSGKILEKLKATAPRR
jgi:CelD/BcsL family acetyltransferase involved in cellulose biosynthesis